MNNINTQKSIYHDIRKKLHLDYSKRKAGSVKYSNQNTTYFHSLINESRSCSEERKAEIELIFKKAKRQNKCSIHIEHILASGNDCDGKAKVEKKLLENRRCTFTVSYTHLTLPTIDLV